MMIGIKERSRVHELTRQAIQKGALKEPESCETCGVGRPRGYDPLQAHHDDYSKPLEVRWLCRSCHIKHHNALRRSTQERA